MRFNSVRMLVLVAASATMATATWASETQKLFASDGEVEDNFGRLGASVSGDTIAIAELEDDDACVPANVDCNSGAIYIFQRDGAGVWQEARKLVASDSAENRNFGNAVGISGDTVVGGATSAGLDPGAAYVFYRDQGGMDNWGEVKKITASDGANFDRFGGTNTVSIQNDTLVVGAKSHNHTDIDDSGAAYVFYRDQGGMDNWGEVKKITASDASSDAFFGTTSLDGDTLLAGAVGDESLTGAAYIFYRDRGGADNWGEVRKLVASDGVPEDWFGDTVAVDGDVAVVGARMAPADLEVGAAYLFGRNVGGADNWGEITKLVAPGGEEGDRFGTCVAIAQDRVVISASGDDDGGSATGALYLFERNVGGPDNWGFVTKLTASDAEPLDLLGGFCGMSFDTLVASAGGHSAGAAESGAAYVFDLERLVFADGFESGDLSAWSQVIPGTP